ncbi:hypothetical protein ACJ8PD_22920 [Serratia sp. CY70267]|uniref:hypothetical protein n=1 Tax=Serratia TaxID=613 RepID=UPI0022205AAB|nr:hypothetical protein [Serratia marcescens]UYU06637.1 hypothetical protein OHY99_25510 [Serratia marcescens]
MKLDEETQKRLRRYQAIINEDRLQYGLSPLTLPQVVAAVFEYLADQPRIFLRGVFIRQ